MKYYASWFLIVLHLLRLLAAISILFPFLDSYQRRVYTSLWSKRLIQIATIEVQLTLPKWFPDEPSLIAANHISWIDAHVINSIKPICFVAQSEVESMPVFGWICKNIGTIFLRKQSARHAKAVVGKMAALLKTESICIFPEGVTSNGLKVLPFKASLFEAAVIADAPVWSLSIQYLSKTTGKKSQAAAFIGETGIVESMRAILKAGGLLVKVTIVPTFSPSINEPLTRNQLARLSHKQITESTA